MDELMHYGVKGMKWGVRRTPEQLGHQKAVKKAVSKTASKVRHVSIEIGKRFIKKVSTSTPYDVMNIAFTVGTGATLTYAISSLAITTGKRFVTEIIKQQEIEKKRREQKKEERRKQKEDAKRQNEAELTHYGVKGMKWGVRKDEPSSKQSSTLDSKSTDKSLGNTLANKINDAKALFVELKGDLNYYMTDAQIAAYFAFDTIMPGTKPITLGLLAYVYLRQNGKLEKFGMYPKTEKVGEKNKNQNKSSELIHYGVKGMKWGVRRTKEELGYKTYSKQKGDTILKKGTNLQRITTNANSSITKGVYTSYKTDDKDLYKGVLGRMRISSLAQEGKDVTLKEITMTSKEDIRIPSREVRIEEFKKLYNSNPSGVKKLIEEHDEGRKGRYYGEVGDKNFSRKGKLDQTYQRFNDALAMGSNSKNKDVINDYYLQLKRRGYNAIADENDIRLSTFKANAPIILFNSNQSIGKQLTRELSASEVFSAYDRSIGKKTARQLLLRKGIGNENLNPDSSKKAAEHAEQLLRDKVALNHNYTLNDLANDWGKERLSRSQIERVSRKMDQGKTHDEAVAEVTGFGNVVVDVILNKFKL